MEALGSDVAQKLKSAIKAKLKELDAYIDDELPEYILVMVANKKPRATMTQDLALFLGGHALQFTDWLFTVLQKLQSATDLDQPSEEKIKSDVKTTKDRRNSNQLGIESALEVVNQELGIELDNQTSNQEDPDEILAIKAEHEVDDLLAAELLEDQAASKPVTKSSSVAVIKATMSAENVPKVSTIKPFVRTIQTAPATSKVVSLVQERPKPTQASEAAATVISVASNKRSRPGLASTIGSTIQRAKMFVDEDEEDGYDPCNPSLPSVIKINPRKSSVPPSLQANKALLLKAVAEATKSVTSSGKGKSSYEEMKEEEEEVQEICVPDELDNRPAVEVRTLQRRLNIQIATSQPSVDKDVMDFQDSGLDNTELDYGDAREMKEPVYNPTPKRNSYDEEENGEFVDERPKVVVPSPKFIVTLDGITSRPTSITTNRGNKRTIECLEDDKEEEVMEQDHDHDETLEEEEQMEEGSEDPSPAAKKAKVAERCRFWPACKEGNSCSYHHPSVPCKAFPKCVFKEKCKYIHPNCRFDAMCTKPDCPFTHASKPFKPTPPTKTICRFFPKCTNMSCIFFHPTPCRFGQSCSSKGCLYLHAAVATPDQLKWTAPSLKTSTISRPFSFDRAEQYMPVEIATKEN